MAYNWLEIWGVLWLHEVRGNACKGKTFLLLIHEINAALALDLT